MRYYLLSENGNDYKANLHCHTNISDGKLTPQEVKELYKSLGYSIVAYTDHDIFITHNELTDGEFLALNGYENAANEDSDDWKRLKCCHFCAIANSPDIELQPMWNRTMYNCGNTEKYRHLVKFDETKPDYIRRYGSDGISEMMTIDAKEGFFVTYNHPTWSLEGYPEYSGYTGMHAMEMFNGGCIASGYEEFNARVYDDMLRLGRRISALAGDDNHNHENDSGIAWTVIRADELKYESVMKALYDKNTYATMGPEIRALYIEDGKICVECSDACRILYNTGVRSARAVVAPKGKRVNKASFPYDPECGYFRITVIDENGDKAYSNAYFADEIEL